MGTTAGAPKTATDKFSGLIEPEHGVLTLGSKAAEKRESTNNTTSQKLKFDLVDRKVLTREISMRKENDEIDALSKEWTVVLDETEK